MNIRQSVKTSVENGAARVERVLQGTNDKGSPAPIANTIEDTEDIVLDHSFNTVWDRYDALVELDAELSGAVNAMSQSATNFTVIPGSSDPTSLDEDATNVCRDLVQDLNLNLISIDIFRNQVKYGNDINKMIFEPGVGVTGLQSLPINAVSIVDSKDDIITPDEDTDETEEILKSITEDIPELDDTNSGELEVFDRGLYILNELEASRDTRTIDPEKILHFSIDSRSNWHEDQAGRDTYGVWGKSRIEPLEFAMKVKYNTLRNKVAMDDKLVAREIYYVDTTELFGDIPDRQERQKQAEKYVGNLKEKIENLGPDERPTLPEEVSVEVIGPEGKAIDQTDFIEQQNNSTAAALTFPMAGLGRGTTSVKAGEEISSLWAENNIRNLRQTIIRGFKKLFEVHLILIDEKFRKNENGGDELSDFTLAEDVSIPTLKYEPFKEDDMTQKTRQIERLRRQKVITAEEAREKFGVDTSEDAMQRLEEEYNGVLDPTIKATPGVGSEEESEEDMDEEEETEEENTEEEENAE